MKRKLLCTAIVPIGLLVLLCVILTGNYSDGKIDWFQFPAMSSTPIVELVYYDNELIYLGFLKKSVDINLNFDDLLIVTNCENELVYDVKRKRFISPEEKYKYQYSGNNDDSYITDYYNVKGSCRAPWRLRAREY